MRRVAACALVLIAATPAPAADSGAYRVAKIELDAPARSLYWGRWRPGSGRDLLILSDWKVDIWERGEQGFSARPTRTIRLPREPGLVDFGDVRGDEGDEIVLVHRGGVYAAGHDTADLAATPFERLIRLRGAPAPLVTARARLVRDVDGDGKMDLVTPAAGGYRVHLRRGDTFAAGTLLEGEPEISIDVGGPEIVQPLRSRIRIPSLEFKDFNGDGRLDISAWTQDGIRGYLQGEDGFEGKPSFELDLDRLRGEAQAVASPRRARAAARRGVPGRGEVRVHEKDIDADGLPDYLVGSGRFIRIYFGTREGPDFSKPHILLKLSSELQGLGSFDIDGDGRLDLVAVKFERPGLPKLLAAYFVSMTIDFEVLAYRNEGGRRFSRRPTQKVVRSLTLPPLREIVEDLEGFADRFLASVAAGRRFASGDVNGDGRPDAIFLDDDNMLRVFHARAEDEDLGEVQIGKILFDTTRPGWKLQELLDFVASAAYSAARRSVAGRTADLEIPLGPGYEPDELKIRTADLDADGRGDFVIRWNAKAYRVLLSGG